jgi:hypothetical protein
MASAEETAVSAHGDQVIAAVAEIWGAPFAPGSAESASAVRDSLDAIRSAGVLRPFVAGDASRPLDAADFSGFVERVRGVSSTLADILQNHVTTTGRLTRAGSQPSVCGVLGEIQRGALCVTAQCAEVTVTSADDGEPGAGTELSGAVAVPAYGGFVNIVLIPTDEVIFALPTHREGVQWAAADPTVIRLDAVRPLRQDVVLRDLAVDAAWTTSNRSASRETIQP